MTGALSRRILSWTFSVRLRPSLSIPVRSPSFYTIPSYYSILLRPFLSHPSPYYTSVSIRLILSAFHIRIWPDLSELRPRFILFPLLFGYNPYQPNPIALRPFIVFCLLLSYDSFHPYLIGLFTVAIFGSFSNSFLAHFHVFGRETNKRESKMMWKMVTVNTLERKT